LLEATIGAESIGLCDSYEEQALSFFTSLELVAVDPPLPHKGYFGRKTSAISDLKGGSADKILIADGLLLKYLFSQG
jgi:hypothetical protein